MELVNKLNVKTRQEFRAWLIENFAKEKECWINIKRGKPIDPNTFYYLDAVEEALCFGWIDSVWKNVEGVMWSHFTPRQKTSPWTELNKARVVRLEKLGLMTDSGRAVLPDMNFKLAKKVESDMKKAGVYETFLTFPALYQRVRGYNLYFTYKRSKVEYKKSLLHFIEETKNNKMFGEWNDYGRLIEEE